jgi:hypothetical protein
MPPNGWNSQSSSLHVLVRKDELVETDWEAILEARRQLLGRYLANMTLSTIGSVQWWGREVRMTAELASDFLSWRFDGIIGAPEWVEDGQHIRKTWMLTRKGEWVWLVIKLDPEEPWKKASDRRVISVDIWPSSPALFVEAGLNLRRIWNSTAVYIRGFQRRRRELATSADELAAQVAAEEAVLTAYGVVQDRQRRSR